MRWQGEGSHQGPEETNNNPIIHTNDVFSSSNVISTGPIPDKEATPNLGIEALTPTPTPESSQENQENQACSCLDPSVVSLHHPQTGVFACSGVLVSPAVVITLSACLQQDNDEPMLPDVKICGCGQQGLTVATERKTTGRGGGKDDEMKIVLNEDSMIAVLLLDEIIPASFPLSPVGYLSRHSHQSLVRLSHAERAWNEKWHFSSRCELVWWENAPGLIPQNSTSGRTLLAQNKQVVKKPKRMCPPIRSSPDECVEALQPSTQAFPGEGVFKIGAVICDGELLGLGHWDNQNFSAWRKISTWENSSATDYATIRFTSLAPMGLLLEALVTISLESLAREPDTTKSPGIAGPEVQTQPDDYDYYDYDYYEYYDDDDDNDDGPMGAIVGGAPLRPIASAYWFGRR